MKVKKFSGFWFKKGKSYVHIEIGSYTVRYSELPQPRAGFIPLPIPEEAYLAMRTLMGDSFHEYLLSNRRNSFCE